MLMSLVFVASKGKQSKKLIKIVKSYLCYKTINSQNVPSEVQVKIIFWFYRKVVFYSQDIQIFVFLTIQCFNKFVTS